LNRTGDSDNETRTGSISIEINETGAAETHVVEVPAGRAPVGVLAGGGQVPAVPAAADLAVVPVGIRVVLADGALESVVAPAGVGPVPAVLVPADGEGSVVVVPDEMESVGVKEALGDGVADGVEKIVLGGVGVAVEEHGVEKIGDGVKIDDEVKTGDGVKIDDEVKIVPGEDGVLLDDDVGLDAVLPVLGVVVLPVQDVVRPVLGVVLLDLDVVVLPVQDVAVLPVQGVVLPVLDVVLLDLDVVLLDLDVVLPVQGEVLPAGWGVALHMDLVGRDAANMDSGGLFGQDGVLLGWDVVLATEN